MTLSFLTVSFLGLCDFLASQFSSYISGTPLLTHLYGMLFHFLPLTCQYSHKLHPFPSHILWVIFSISMVLNYLCFMTFKSISLWIYRFNFFFYIYIYFPPTPAALGLRCCPWAFSSCGEWGLLSSCSARASDRGGFTWFGAWALSMWASGAAAHGLSKCSSWA